jgi:hypothetical protein
MIVRFALLAAGVGCVAASYAFGARAQETPAPTAVPLPQHLASRPQHPALIAVRADPFVSLTQSRATTIARTGSPGKQAGTFSVSPGGPQIQTGVGGVASPPQTVVLCATWESAADGHVPTAVFYVGRDAIVAGPGDDVGGYTLASVSRSAVTFQTGERLEMSDCSTLGPNDDQNGEVTQSQPVNGATIAPGATMPTEIATPAPFVPAPTRGATPATQSGSPFDSTYQGTSGGYGTDVYGQSAPSPRPIPVLPANAFTRPAGTP